mgnify:CR=1 FL=1
MRSARSDARGLMQLVLAGDDPESLNAAAAAVERDLRKVPPHLTFGVGVALLVLLGGVLGQAQIVGFGHDGRKLLQGRGNPLDTLETEGQIIQRVIGFHGLCGSRLFHGAGFECYSLVSCYIVRICVGRLIRIVQRQIIE